jgi:hypothetical protein
MRNGNITHVAVDQLVNCILAMKLTKLWFEMRKNMNIPDYKELAKKQLYYFFVQLLTDSGI